MPSAIYFFVLGLVDAVAFNVYTFIIVIVGIIRNIISSNDITLGLALALPHRSSISFKATTQTLS